ncbi:MAG: hypothetical protein QXZ20_02365 [Candidatus Aenigmatarchaeota archaeon]
MRIGGKVKKYATKSYLGLITERFKYFYLVEFNLAISLDIFAKIYFL